MHSLPHFGLCLVVSGLPTFSHKHTHVQTTRSLFLHPALHMGVWVAAAHLLLPLLLLLLLLMQLLLPLLQDLIVKYPLKFSSHLYLEEKHWLEACLSARYAR